MHITVKQKLLVALRVAVSFVFLVLGLVKIVLIYNYGLDPYVAVAEATGLPSIIKYYGFVAIGVEFYLSIGLWSNRHYRTSILLAGMMCLLGVIVSVVLIGFRLSSECGCGLLGDNEVGILVQKLVLLAGLFVLYKKKDLLFVS